MRFRTLTDDEPDLDFKVNLRGGEYIDTNSDLCLQDTDMQIKTWFMLTLPKLSDSALHKLHGKLCQAVFRPVSKVLLSILLETRASCYMKRITK